MATRKRPPPRKEHDEQVAFVRWWRAQFPNTLLFAIPNGGARNIVTAAHLKAEGVVAGMLDMHAPEWRLWIEMKRTKLGRVSSSQRSMIRRLEAIGHTVIVAFGDRDARRQVLEFLEKGGSDGD